MPSLGESLMNQKMTFNCPECGAQNTATLKQMEAGQTITCRGCRKPIKLNMTGDPSSDLAKELDKFKRSLKNINIRL